jgi:hypothetical protein
MKSLKWHFFAMALAFSYHSTSFTATPVGPCQCIY